MRSVIAPWLPILLTAVAAGCSALSPPESGAPDSPLLPSVQATAYGDSVGFALQVTNIGAEPVTLEFRSGRQFDFVVLDEAREVWRWSADRAFTQAIQRQSLSAGETLTYTAGWTPPPSLRGEFVVRGILDAAEHRVEQQARFRIP